MIKIIVGLLIIIVPVIAIRYFGQLLKAVLEYYSTPGRTPAYFKTVWKESGKDAEECFWSGVMFLTLVRIFGFVCWMLGDILL